MKELVKIRQEVKKRKPKFVRYLYRRYKKLRRSSYRRPKGRHNKMRLRIFGKPKTVSVSYGAPRKARHLHPSGYREVIVHNVKELENIDPETCAVRIASAVGTKKKMEIVKKAEELGIKVLNPRIRRKSWLELKAREEKKKEVKKEEKAVEKEEKAEKEIAEKKVKKEKGSPARKVKETGVKKREADDTIAKSGEKAKGDVKRVKKGAGKVGESKVKGKETVKTERKTNKTKKAEKAEKKK